MKNYIKNFLKNFDINKVYLEETHELKDIKMIDLDKVADLFFASDGYLSIYYLHKTIKHEGFMIFEDKTKNITWVERPLTISFYYDGIYDSNDYYNFSSEVLYNTTAEETLLKTICINDESIEYDDSLPVGKTALNMYYNSYTEADLKEILKNFKKTDWEIVLSLPDNSKNAFTFYDEQKKD